MSKPPEILCPRPTKDLKRKISQLDCSQTPFIKRPRLSSSIEYWLDNIPDRVESRSDSFLLDLSSCRYCETRSDGFLLHHRQDMPREAPVPGDLPPSIIPESIDSRNSRDRVAHPTYRRTLGHHNVYIDAMGFRMPPTVQQFVKEVVQKSRSSPSLTAEEIRAVQERVEDLSERSEAPISRELLTTSIFPSETQPGYSRRLQTGGNTPFSTTPLPYTPQYNYLPIVTPSPDVHYGYDNRVFSKTQLSVLGAPQLSSYTMPTADNILPCLIFELKSQAHKGSRWVAENQAAGAGAHCVSSMETLLDYAKQANDSRTLTTTDTLCFSSVIDTEAISLWVHFKSDEAEFYGSKVDAYFMSKPEDVQRFRRDAKNILDHALDGRLTKVKEAIQDLLPTLEPPKGKASKRKTLASSRSSSRPVESVAGGTAPTSFSEASQPKRVQRG
ncbi:hypothetical protein MMC30_007731 [Trapelia coarctata]|nr:hypothetical protein [Trapelia coarctata]